MNGPKTERVELPRVCPECHTRTGDERCSSCGCQTWDYELTRKGYEEMKTGKVKPKDVIKPPAGGTYCAYCSEQFPSDNDAADQISKHIAICPKHPMRVPEEERDKAKAEVVRLRARDERWKRAVKEYYTRCLLDPHADTEMNIFIDAGFALKDGNLEALEKVLGIKDDDGSKI